MKNNYSIYKRGNLWWGGTQENDASLVLIMHITVSAFLPTPVHSWWALRELQGASTAQVKSTNR